MALTALLLWASTALATPSLSDLMTALDRQEVLLSDAIELRAAVTRVENEVGGKLRLGIERCEAHESALMRLAVLGPAWRDAVQSARVQQARVDRLVVAPSVAPLLEQTGTTRAATYAEQVRAEAHQYRLSNEWLARDVRGRLRRCEPALVVGSPPFAGETTAWVVGWTGTVCTADGAGGLRAVRLNEPRAVRVNPPVACWSEGACDCTPETVATGAALGPPTRPNNEETP